MSGGQRKICYLTGSRADFGLMLKTLQAIDASPGCTLSVIVTGMHLSERFGLTVREIEEAGFNISARIPVAIEQGTGAAMARNLAKTLDGCVTAIESAKPDIFVVLGDRGEMLAGTIAAIHLNTPVVHIHGGERSGTVDEPVRHAISKLAHFHFVSTQGARERLERMGERSDHIFVTGAPGLDGLQELVGRDRASLCASADFDPAKPVALFVYHPVLQEVDNAESEASSLLQACIDLKLQVIGLMPNSDAGHEKVRSLLKVYAQHPHIRVIDHLPRAEFVSWMAVCDVMIGNSSSGIIEAATFGTPVLNVGTRQNLRERNANVVDVQIGSADIRQSITDMLKRGRSRANNIYGQGNTAEKIAGLLDTIELSPATLCKANVY